MAESRAMPEDPRDMIVPAAVGDSEEGAPETSFQMAEMTLELPAYLVEECRDAVAFLSGLRESLTMEQLAEIALQSYLKQLRDEHNRGGPFPERKA